MNEAICAKCGRSVERWSEFLRLDGTIEITAYCHGEEEMRRVSTSERLLAGSKVLFFFAPKEPPKPEPEPEPQSTDWFHAVADESRREALVRAKAMVSREDPVEAAIELYLLNDAIRKASRCPEGESLVTHIIRLRRAADGETP